jgi:hypothetical protein
MCRPRLEPGTYQICHKTYHLSQISRFDVLTQCTNNSRQQEMNVELILPLNRASYDLLATIWQIGRKEI